MLQKISHQVSRTVLRIVVAVLILLVGACVFLIYFELSYKNRLYPNIFVGGVWFGGKLPEDVFSYWESRNIPFTQSRFEFRFGESVATVSGAELALGYDAQLAATQAYDAGRSGSLLADLKTKFLKRTVDLTPLYSYKTELIDQILDSFSTTIDIPPQDALFTFEDGKVTAFKPSVPGRRVNRRAAENLFTDAASSLEDTPQPVMTIIIPVEDVFPQVTTVNANSFGIKEHISTGYSEFSGSIPGRIHNVVLAASRFHGVLIKPGEIFSFNKILGDVSSSTGYQQAYIIKGGRTVLGDGGGVCQVSTTFFRAALNAGLPIVERNAHAYRVHYYEEGGFNAGMDATVFEPTVDLKIKNDTPGYLLIQTKTDVENLSLTFDIYGQKDGRKSEILEQHVWGITPPPEALYQDDPTLPVGVTRQVDFAAWGAKASFKYKVTRGTEVLQDTEFFSNYRPWQAVFLRGTKQ